MAPRKLKCDCCSKEFQMLYENKIKEYYWFKWLCQNCLSFTTDFKRNS